MADEDGPQVDPWALAGQVHALKGALMAMIQTHPDRAAFLRELRSMDIVTTAALTPEPVPEAFLEAYASVVQSLDRCACLHRDHEPD